MKVTKIGGGCLKDGPAAKAIIELIVARGQGDIFVLSAFYGVTDILLTGIDSALENEANIRETLRRLRRLHHDVIQEMIQDANQRKQLSRSLADIYTTLERYSFGISFTREASARMRDVIATFGERISALILAGALNRPGAGQYCCPKTWGSSRTAGFPMPLP